MAVLVLVVLIGGTVYAVRLYFFPFRDCRRCGGTGRKHSGLSRRSYDLCRHCAGNGHVQRPGARLLHKSVLTARSPAARSRLWQKDRDAIDRSAPPRRTAARRELPGRDIP
jgi:hypothetical protein